MNSVKVFILILSSLLKFNLFAMEKSYEETSSLNQKKTPEQKITPEDNKVLESQWNDFCRKLNTNDMGLVDIEFILNDLKFLAYANTNYQFTPLHFAAIGKPEKIYDYLGRGISIESKDKIRSTPLHIAAVCNPESVKILIEVGADREAKKAQGYTPVHVAAQYNSESLKILIANGVDIESKAGRHDSRPLHIAAQYNPENVKGLIASGADIEAKTKDGWTPLHIAALNPESLKVLIVNGADIEAKDQEGCTPLHGAVGLNIAQSVKILLKNGANPDAINDQKSTPLQDFIIKLQCNPFCWCDQVRYLPMIRVFFDYISNKDLDSSFILKMLNTLQLIKRDLGRNDLLSFNQYLHDAGYCIEQDISVQSDSLNALFNLLRFNNFKTIHEFCLNLNYVSNLSLELKNKLLLAIYTASLHPGVSDEIDEHKRILNLKEIISPVIYNEVVNLIKNGVTLNIMDLKGNRLADYAAEAGDKRLLGLLAYLRARIDYITVKKLIERSHFNLLEDLILK